MAIPTSCGIAILNFGEEKSTRRDLFGFLVHILDNNKQYLM
jgi:hypothetical protein